jgi:hypothetical protein
MATETDLVLLAKSQGLTPENARLAGAVAWVESKGDANAHNTNAATGDNSYGYWQINMLGAMGPERRAQFGISRNDQLFDPQTNARAMKILSKNGTDFATHWPNTLPLAQQRVKTHLIQTEGSGPDDGGRSTLDKIGDALNPVDELGGLVDFGNKTARWVSNAENWVRVGYVVGGGAMIIVGLVMMIQSTTLGTAVTQVIPAGRVASMVKKGATR